MNLRAFGWSRLQDMGDVLLTAGQDEVSCAPGKPDFEAGNPAPEITDGWDPFGWLHADGKLVSEPRQLIRLENCSVLRTSLGRDRWHIVGPSGDVCGIESYHDGRWIARHIGETVTGDLGDGTTVQMNLMDATPFETTVEEPHVLISHFWDQNYCNMLFETASRFWCRDDETNVFRLPVLWETVTPWMVDLAARFDCQAVPMPRGIASPAQHVRFETLYVPSFYSQLSPPSRSAIRWLRNLYWAPADTGTRRLYVTRSDATSRRITNELELLALLTPLGFECVSLVGMSLVAQRDLFCEASIVVAPHGAGCANLVFAGPSAALIEIVPRSYQHHAFHYLTTWSGQWYARIVVDDVANHDMRVDLADVRKALEVAGV